MIRKFVEDQVKPSGPFNRVLFLSTVIIVVCIGFYIYLTMITEIEEYEGEIESIGPPGVTNIVPVVVITLVSAFISSIVLKVKRNKKIGE